MKKMSNGMKILEMVQFAKIQVIHHDKFQIYPIQQNEHIVGSIKENMCNYKILFTNYNFKIRFNFIKERLVDEFIITISPTLIGHGIPLFKKMILS